ncbi:MAG: ATP-binding protein [Proteobacteria bacterium]|nr:ATP-binding protein [Pseudomonadota bacterium]
MDFSSQAMMLTAQAIEELLERAEGRDLDFKEGPYRFKKGAEDEKGELLKDILAFANTSRMHDAHILIGVREVRGGKSVAVGVSEHLDDASIHQFVNSKTNRPVDFTYEVIPYNGVELGILSIAKHQSRPLWASDGYGKVKARCVYLRHGSSTAEASPDEIADMARADMPPVTQRQPMLTISLHDPTTDENAKAQFFERRRLVIPDPASIPDFAGLGEQPTDLASAISHVTRNREYYRQGAAFLAQDALLVPLDCCVQNIGDATANGVRVILTLLCDPGEVELINRPALLNAPQARTNIVVVSHVTSAMRIDRVSKGWIVHRDMPKIYAKQGLFFRDELFIRATRTVDLSIQATVWADELAFPAVEPLAIHIEVAHVQVPVNELIEALNRKATEQPSAPISAR